MCLSLYLLFEQISSFKLLVYITKLDHQAWKKFQEHWLEDAWGLGFGVECHHRVHELFKHFNGEGGWFRNFVIYQRRWKHFGKPTYYDPLFGYLENAALELCLDLILFICRQQCIGTFLKAHPNLSFIEHERFKISLHVVSSKNILY